MLILSRLGSVVTLAKVRPVATAFDGLPTLKLVITHAN